MDLNRRTSEWHVLRGLCQGLIDPLWRPLWTDARALYPEDFTQADLGMVFKILRRFREVFVQELVAHPESFRGALSKELEVVSLGAFNVEGLLHALPTDPCLPEIREKIGFLLREKRGAQ